MEVKENLLEFLKS